MNEGVNTPFVAIACGLLAVIGITIGLVLRKLHLSDKAGYTMVLIGNFIGIALIPGMDYPKNIVLAVLILTSMAIIAIQLLNKSDRKAGRPNADDADGEQSTN